MKILIFGTVPPPIGGVTKSIENLYNALKFKDINVNFFHTKSLFQRYKCCSYSLFKKLEEIYRFDIWKNISKKG